MRVRFTFRNISNELRNNLQPALSSFGYLVLVALQSPEYSFTRMLTERLIEDVGLPQFLERAWSLDP